jgi:3-oxoacyl-[acyl-carrier protein] reductase
MEADTTTPGPGIAGRTALVTGASRGIGRAIADALAARGAIVVGTATSADGAAAITENFARNGCEGRGAVLDVSDEVSIDALLEDVNAREGAPLIVVNNAGITRDNLLMRMKSDDWEAVIVTNLTGVFRLCRACLRGMMKARHGRIINIGSVVGLTGNPGQANYAAAKAGIIGFTKSLAREVASRNITVNTIAPGFIDTDMTRALDAAQVEALRGQIPAGRLGTVEDIAAGAIFLASDAASYITGETLNINGGMYMP